MNIGRKLILSFAGLLAVAFGLGVSSLFSIGSLGGALKTATDLTTKKVFLIAEMQGQLFRMRSCQRGVMLFAMHSLPDKVQSNKQEFESRAASIEQAVREIKPLLVTEAGRNSLAFIETELPNFKQYFEQVAAAAMAGNAKGALEIYTDHSVKSLDSLEKSAENLVELQRQLMQESSMQGAQTSSRAQWIAWIFLLAALGISAMPLTVALQTTKQLRGVTADLGKGAQQIASASGQIASSSQALAQGASEQAASLEETSSSSQEITSMTQKNAENSQAAATVMAEVDKHVQAGNRTLEEMVISMREITTSSDKISKIIKVIDEIAFQTNILALNAAVEAARAGEAGMGFAVVADEVRNLAQRSAQAAKDTAALIEESIAKSNEGGTKLGRVTEVIRAITASAARVKTLVDEVNLGSQEQSRGIEQISKALGQMDQVTQDTAASAEQSASASEEMSAQAEALDHIVATLRSLVGSDGQETRSPRGQRPAQPSSVRRAAPPSSTLTPSRDLKKLNSAVSSPAMATRAKAAAPSMPLEDHFVEM
jgi:methyl-accepting chemotaxis protein